MRLYSFPTARSGTTILECAIVLPLTFFLLLMMVVGAMGVFRYQEVASLARSGARYASTHGAQYRTDASLGIGTPGTYLEESGGLHWYTADPLATSGADPSWTQDIYDSAIRPNLVALDPAALKVKIGWPPVINQADKPDNWPASKVTVVVTYQWTPEFAFFGPINLTSTSTMYLTN